MIFSLAFFAGVELLLVQAAVPAAWMVLPLALAVLLSFLVLRRFTGAPAAFAVTGGICAGFLYAAVQAHAYVQHRWPRSSADERVIAQVVVDTIPAARDAGWSFDGIVSIEAPARTHTPLRVRLISRDPGLRPHAGERWRMLLALRPPRARANPGAADAERTLFHDRVHAFGRVIPSPLNRRIDAGYRPLASLRERIARHIDERVVDRDASALIRALAVGVTGAMSREQWRVFNATGTTHLVAISGLHVTLFAVIAFALARGLWTTMLWRVVRWPRESFAAACGFTGAVAYATLAGLSVPTQRTLIMLGVWLFARSIARESTPFRPFAIALLVVLLLDPFAPLAAGFWLSFGAMAAIILVTATRFARRRFLHEAVAVQAAVTLALAPLTLASFGSLSIAGPLVNAAAIPAMGWIFVPAILLSIALLPLWTAASDAVLAAAAWMHDIGWPWLAAASDLPWSLAHASPPRWWFAAAAVSALVSLMPFPNRLRLAVLLWLIPVAFAGGAAPMPGGAEMTVLDVGNGTSTVIRTSKHVLVYGTGEVYGTDGRTVESVLVPFLRSRGIDRIDTLIVSRLTPASSQGIAAVLARMGVTRTLLGTGGQADFDGARDCAAQGAWEWEGVSFQVLHPDAGSSGASGAEAGAPCALLVETRTGRVFLTGDIEPQAAGILARRPHLMADVVVVHRGANGGSAAELLRTVGARWGVISGRQAADQDARLRLTAGFPAVLTTEEMGAIRFDFDAAAGIRAPRGWRSEHRTVWRSP